MNISNRCQCGKMRDGQRERRKPSINRLVLGQMSYYYFVLFTTFVCIMCALSLNGIPAASAQHRLNCILYCKRLLIELCVLYAKSVEMRNDTHCARITQHQKNSGKCGVLTRILSFMNCVYMFVRLITKHWLFCAHGPNKQIT